MLYKNIECNVEYTQYERVCPNGQCQLIKTASKEPDIFKDIRTKKNHAYLYVIAMGAGDYYGPNKNGDFFWEKDLITYHPKFLTSGVFIQHRNKDPEKSIGKVLKSIYNKKMHRVELVIEISKEKAPDIYQSIEEGNRISVSMGTNVTEESCSLCGHITRGSLANRCDHLKKMMNKVTEDGIQIFAYNHPPLNFFDISIVRVPADHQGYALFQKTASYDKVITDPTEATEKIADIIKRIKAKALLNRKGKLLSLSEIANQREKTANFIDRNIDDAFGNKTVETVAKRSFSESNGLFIKKYPLIEIIFTNGESITLNADTFAQIQKGAINNKAISAIIGIEATGNKVILWQK